MSRWTTMLKTAVSTLLLALTVAGAPSSLKQAINCGGSGFLDYGAEMNFTSPGFSNAYANGLHCLWGYSSPYYTSMRLYCQFFDTAPSAGCNEDAFLFSPTGRLDMQDSVNYCGTGTLEVITYYNHFAVRFFSQNDHLNTHLGFTCQLTVLSYYGWGSELATPNPNPSVTSPVTTAEPPSTTTTTTEPPSSTTTTTEPPSSTTTTTEPPSSTTTTTEPPSSTTTTTEPPSPGGDCVCGEKGGSRVVGGQETEVNEWPWQAGLRYVSTNALYCGASLINNQWLVTAAHCVQQFSAEEIYASLGDHDKNDINESSFAVSKSISEIIIHEAYNDNIVDNDIALLRLSTPVSYTGGVKPICLPFQYVSQNLSGETGVVTGWGTLTYLGSLSDVLMEVELPILTTSECQEYSITSSITENMICTYDAGKDACQGDSGGPLQWAKNGRQYLVGLVSFGYGCGDVDSPGVYTKVVNYLDWIEAKISEDICHPTP